MFHTPPSKWTGEQAVHSSYNAEDGLFDLNEYSGSDATLKGEALAAKEQHREATETVEVENDSEETKADEVPAEADGAQSQKECRILDPAFEIPTESELPVELQQECESFLKYLREPRFARPLATCEIADLFQQFYVKFSTKSQDVVANTTKDVVELSDYTKSPEYLHYRYNIIAERFVCDRFYSFIMFPEKRIPLDDQIRKVSDDLGVKLALLHALDIKFANLDILLPESQTGFFVHELHERILPLFELFSSERSPTLKVKYLYDVHTELGEIIKQVYVNDGSTKIDFAMNTDVYLPVLIYTIIQLEDLRTHSLASQLFFLKQYTDEAIFASGDDKLKGEQGKMLYITTNFEACLSYIASLTLEELHIKPPGNEEELAPTFKLTNQQAVDLLTKPLPFDDVWEEVRKYKEENPLPRTEFHGEQTLRNISKSVDVSLKSIMGKVPWIGSPAGGTAATSADDLQRQLEENLVMKTSLTSTESPPSDHNNKISPISSVSTNGSGNQQVQTASTPPTRPYKHHSSFSISSTGSRKIEALPDNTVLGRFTNSVGSAMKNFLPASGTSSTASLNGIHNGESSPISDIFGLQTQPPPPTRLNSKVRSRATSLMNGSFFGTNPTVQQRVPRSNSMQQISDVKPGLFNTLETALETVKNRSRGNSSAGHSQQQPKKFNKSFEEMSVAELHEMFDSYQAMVNNL